MNKVDSNNAISVATDPITQLFLKATGNVNIKFTDTANVKKTLHIIYHARF